MPVVDLYTVPACPPCDRARRLLRRRGIAFAERRVDELAGGTAALVERTGSPTVPQVVIRGQPIGDADALARLDRRGVLGPLVRGDPFPVAVIRRRVAAAALLAWARAPFASDFPGARRYTVDLVDSRGRVLERIPADSALDAERILAARAASSQAVGRDEPHAANV